jgi:hypothetical protein
MENQLAVSQKKDNQYLELSSELTKIGQVIVHINQLTPFPYSDFQLIDWAKSINELTPELTPDILKKIIDKFKLGIYEFDSRAGIQNVFRGYKLILGEKIDFLRSQRNETNSEEITEKMNYYSKLQFKVSPKQINYNGGIL